MKERFEALVARVQEELEKSTVVRLGAWGIAGVLLLWFALTRGDAVALAHADYVSEARRLATATGALDGGDWASRLAREQAVGGELEGMLWQADFEGHAQAELEEALTSIFEPLDLGRRRIRMGVSQPAPDLPGVWQVQAQVSAEYRTGAELAALHAVATYPRRLAVERFVITTNPRRIDVIVSAYFTGFGGDDGA